LGLSTRWGEINKAKISVLRAREGRCCCSHWVQAGALLRVPCRIRQGSDATPANEKARTRRALL
jgi:hypothetical protein